MDSVSEQIEELKAKYAEAQRNAQKAMALYKETKEENIDLKSNFETLKQAYQRLQEKYQKSENEHSSTKNEMHRVLRERDLQIQQWRAELEIKSRQFEDIKNQAVPPRELDEVRLRIMEELDLPNRERCQILEAELEKQREGFFQMRRQLEKMKFEKDQIHAEHEQNILEVTEKHRAIEAELNIRISGLQAALEDTTEVEEIHALQREVQAGKLREQQLLTEIHDVRAEKEKWRVEKEKAAQVTRDKVEEVESEMQKKDMLFDELRRKIAHLDRELIQETEAHQRTEAQLLSWERENASLRNKLEDSQAALRNAAKEAAKLRQEDDVRAEHERDHLKREIQEQIRKRDEQQQAFAAARDHLEEDVERKITALKEEHAKRAIRRDQEFQKRETMLEDQLSEIRQRDEGLKTQVMELQLKLDSQKTQVEDADRDRKQYEENIASLRQQLVHAEEERDLRNKHLDEMEVEYKDAQERLVKASLKETSLEHEKKLLEENLRAVKEELSTLGRSIAAERANYQSQVQRAQEEAMACVGHTEVTTKSLRAELSDARAKAKRNATIAKKIKEKCKTRMSALGQKVKNEEAAISKLKDMLNDADERLEAEKAAAARRLRDSERRCEHLQLLLGDAAGAAAAAREGSSIHSSGLGTTGGAAFSAPDSPATVRAMGETMGDRPVLSAAQAAAAGGSGPTTPKRQLAALPRAGPRKDDL